MRPMDSTIYDPLTTMMDTSPVSAEPTQFLQPAAMQVPMPYMPDYHTQYPMMDQTVDIMPHFSMNTTSSLASALDPAAAVPVARSRANTLSALPPFMPAATFCTDVSVKQEETPKERVVGNMLRNIAQVIKTAGDACHQNQAARPITPGDEQKTRQIIHQINDLIQGMGLPTTTSQTEPSRKRHGGEMNAKQPPVKKILKAEPEDVNLSALPVASTYVRTHTSSKSQPSSRPHTPPLNIKPVPANFRPPPFPQFNIPNPSFETAHRFGHPNRHHHSRSMGSIPREVHGFNASSAPAGRMARNGYFAQEHGWSQKGISPKSAPTLTTFTYPGTIDVLPPVAAMPPATELVDEEDEDGDDGDDTDTFSPSGSSQHSYSDTTPVSDIPSEYRAEVDRLFKVYLNRICSNLDATDNKGDPIHQQLMAKKMQKLDESMDFRPFKFRIQAFTAAFLEMLAENGYPEEKIPMKKVRNYLWRQPLILRFNEDGKKAKSKGNHIWNVDGKKTPDGWEFRPFVRKIAGTPPPVAYCSIQWTWKPRIWDPQACWHNIPVYYSSPSLPPWLQWRDDVLSGTPPPSAESCEITAHAKFSLEGQEGMLTRTFFLTIVPATAETPFPPRPLIAPRRSVSDSTLPAWSTPLSVPADEEDEARVKSVLEQVAERLTQETQPPGELSVQKTLVEQTVNACLDDCEEAEKAPERIHELAEAGSKVVAQAAEYIVRKQSLPLMSHNTSAMQNVDTDALVETTKDVIAEAVKETTQKAPATEIDELSVLLIACRMLDTALLRPPPPPPPQQQRWVDTAVPMALPDWYVQQYV
ncbi:hypothetical protein C8F01DRAFT_1133163 [Mycena amicta]|nr:hypothetical protein C8F01DRAFT_1133163 [Mycena amicta]